MNGFEVLAATRGIYRPAGEMTLQRGIGGFDSPGIFERFAMITRRAAGY